MAWRFSESPPATAAPPAPAFAKPAGGALLLPERTMPSGTATASCFSSSCAMLRRLWGQGQKAAMTPTTHSRPVRRQHRGQAQLSALRRSGAGRPTFSTNRRHRRSDQRDRRRPGRRHRWLHISPSSKPIGSGPLGRGHRLRSGCAGSTIIPNGANLTKRWYYTSNLNGKDQHTAQELGSSAGKARRQRGGWFLRCKVLKARNHGRPQQPAATGVLLLARQRTPGPAWLPLRHLRKKKPPASSAA